jgi:RNA polymerase sigma-70 factor, ECF subfamily
MAALATKMTTISRMATVATMATATSRTIALSPRPAASALRDTNDAVEPGAGGGGSLADEAMGRYAAGDPIAFEQVYDVVAPRIASYLHRRINDQVRVDDLVQQTFLHIHQARGTFIPGAQVLPWAFAIARRLMFDANRRARREILVDALHDRRAPAFMQAAASGEEMVGAREAAGQLSAAVARLSEPQRNAFELMKGEGLTLAQAAAVLGTTVLGVKLRMHRVHAALRAAIGDAGNTSARTIESEKR